MTATSGKNAEVCLTVGKSYSVRPGGPHRVANAGETSDGSALPDGLIPALCRGAASERKREREGRRRHQGSSPPGSPAVELDDRSRDRQAEAGALLLGRVERLEDIAQPVGRDAGPVVQTPEPSLRMPMSGWSGIAMLRVPRASCIASIALIARLRTTCCRCTGSARTGRLTAAKSVSSAIPRPSPRVRGSSRLHQGFVQVELLQLDVALFFRNPANPLMMLAAR